ncbi:Hypotetical protein [Gulosibacter molinativorax]|nr:Hypotetical protein [Gulosibacter molinativorax]
MVDGDGVLEGLTNEVGGERIVHGTCGHDGAMGEQEGVGGCFGDLFEMVSDEHGREIGMARGEPVDRLQKLLSCGDIESGRGLVEEQERWVAHQCAGDECPPPLTLRESRPSLFGFPVEAEQVDQLGGAAALGSGGLPAHHELRGAGDTGEDDVGDRERGFERMPRVDVSDAATQREQFDTTHPMAQKVYGASGGERAGTAETEDRALARPVRADQHPVLPGIR